MSAMYVLWKLLDGYGTDSEITDILDHTQIHLISIVNIDGFKYTWSKNAEKVNDPPDDFHSEREHRFWRKNRRDNGDGTFGVDLNRNWGPDDTWCTVGSSFKTSSDEYCGPSKESEPEVQAVRAFLMDKDRSVKAAVDMHSFGRLVLHPWIHSTDQYSVPRYDELHKLTKEMASAINAVHGAGYTPEMGSKLYSHSGSMMDRLLPVNGMLAFEIELRGPGFDPPADTIIKAGEEVFAGIKVLAKTQYMPPRRSLFDVWSSWMRSDAACNNLCVFTVTLVVSLAVSIQSFLLIANV